ncbi:DUF2141 domain-containing protein [Chamaesiphon sp. VAR_69_metabat_338]|uniref:DUF2141 domain-containing protein n=1 Tax=Chamaesiphon sp. VAR_69_metabat_338 TaxID=2964704 RepID=UPI00286DD1C2|nr:DUF2141 domain-containing protein [Chamaesiphon sp. VAR_69_metabat_338]
MISFNKIAVGISSIVATTLVLKVNLASAGYTGSLEVKFNGLNNSKGQVCANLFNGQRGFPGGGSGAAIKAASCAPIKNGSAVVTFANLPYGNYAISAIHDIIGDKKLHRNFLGIPTEGVGFSNNPTVVTSAPGFNDAQFFVARSKTELSIKMKYFN